MGSKSTRPSTKAPSKRAARKRAATPGRPSPTESYLWPVWHRSMGGPMYLIALGATGIERELLTIPNRPIGSTSIGIWWNLGCTASPHDMWYRRLCHIGDGSASGNLFGSTIHPSTGSTPRRYLFVGPQHRALAPSLVYLSFTLYRVGWYSWQFT